MLDRISVISPWFALALFGTAVLTWVSWRQLHRRRARATAVVVLATATMLSAATVATAVNQHYSYWPTIGDLISAADHEHNFPAWPAATAAGSVNVLRKNPRGLVVRLNVPDRGSGFGPTAALVYLPPQYFADPGRRFGVVYLFHGSPGVPGDWFRGGSAAAAAAGLAAQDRPMIVVSPRMSRSWQDDPECVDGSTEKVETHFIRDVVPTVDQLLRTVPTRAGRAVGGMSAGGYCALNLGLRHRGLISAIIDMSGDTVPTHARGLGAIFGTGPNAPALARANSPAVYAPAVQADPPTRIWFDCGDEDIALLAKIRKIAAVLAARGLTVDLHVRDGGHTFHVWRPALAESLAWLTRPSPN